MKNYGTHYYVFIFLLCIVTQVSAQDTKLIKRKLSSTLTEVYEVSKTDKKNKDGKYTVINDDKKVLVTGVYKKNKKDSIWTYYSAGGNVIQRYDFTNNQLVFDDNDAATIVRSNFFISADSTAKNKIEQPYKIGGLNYGFYLLYDQRSIPNEVLNETVAVQSSMNYVFYLSPEGKLEKWDIVFTRGSDKENVINQSIKDLPADAYEFSPAKLNGKPVASKLIFNILLNVNQFNTPASGSNNNMMSHKSN